MTLVPTDPTFDFTELDVNLSLEDRLALVDQLDLSPIAHSLTSPNYGAPAEMTQEEAITAIRQYRCALKLWLMFPDRNVMLTRLIDEVWHTHMLDSTKYVADMVPIFGSYPHHYPYFGIQGLVEEQRRQDDFVASEPLYLEHFGEYVLVASQAWVSNQHARMRAYYLANKHPAKDVIKCGSSICPRCSNACQKGIHETASEMEMMFGRRPRVDFTV